MRNLQDRPLTLSELKDIQSNWVDILLQEKKTISFKGVYLDKFFSDSLTFQYKNARGIISPDNGYLGNNSYYFLVNVSPHYCTMGDIRYSGTCEPTLEAIAKKIKEGWKRFTSGR